MSFNFYDWDSVFNYFSGQLSLSQDEQDSLFFAANSQVNVNRLRNELEDEYLGNDLFVHQSSSFLPINLFPERDLSRAIVDHELFIKLTDTASFMGDANFQVVNAAKNYWNFPDITYPEHLDSDIEKMNEVYLGKAYKLGFSFLLENVWNNVLDALGIVDQAVPTGVAIGKIALAPGLSQAASNLSGLSNKEILEALEGPEQAVKVFELATKFSGMLLKITSELFSQFTNSGSGKLTDLMAESAEEIVKFIAGSDEFASIKALGPLGNINGLLNEWEKINSLSENIERLSEISDALEAGYAKSIVSVLMDEAATKILVAQKDFVVEAIQLVQATKIPQVDAAIKVLDPLIEQLINQMNSQPLYAQLQEWEERSSQALPIAEDILQTVSAQTNNLFVRLNVYSKEMPEGLGITGLLGDGSLTDLGWPTGTVTLVVGSDDGEILENPGTLSNGMLFSATDSVALLAGAGDDTIFTTPVLGAGSSIMRYIYTDGGGGTDKVVLDGNFNDYDISTLKDGSIKLDRVSGPISFVSYNETHFISNVEIFQFNDVVTDHNFMPIFPDKPAAYNLDWLTGPISFADIVEAGHANNDEDFSAIFEAMFGLSVDNLTYSGSFNAAFLTNDFTISGDGVPGFQHGSGLMLSSGGFPGSSNSQSSFTVNHNTPGDADLTATALAAFSGAGQTRDAAVIEFTINVTDPNITALRAELVFGSEEFPVYINSSYVDIAALYVNGVNHALFNNDANRPLSVIIQNVEEGYILNNNNGNGPFGDYNGWSGAAAPYGIEWNGFSAPLSVRAPLQMGENVIKIGVADTGDTAWDSGLFIANLQLIGGGGGGTGVLSILDATNSNSVTPTTLTEEVLIGSAPTTISGTPLTLNNDIIVGFKTSDLLVFNGHQFSLDQMQISAGSAILEIDTNSDGEFDTKVTLAGVSHESNFNVTLVDGNTVITYDDPDVSGLSVSGVIAGRGGEGMSGSTVTFVPDSGDGVQIGTNTAGLFSLSLPSGSSGHLHALREYDPATDGTITASDALDVLRLAVGLAPSWGNATPLDFIAADINQDGEVTAADALEVLRAAVGLQSVHQPRWVFFDTDIDLSGVNRGHTDIEMGVRIDALTAGLADVSMTGVLLGNMQEYA